MNRPAIRVLVALALAAAVLAWNQPAHATVRFGSDYAEYVDSYNDCGFIVDVSGVFSVPKDIARVAKGKNESFFFGHSPYTFTESHTNRVTGETYLLSGTGVFHDLHAKRLHDSVFLTTRADVGRFTIADAQGHVVYQERGLVLKTLVFDTGGDDVLGGQVLEEIGITFHGNFPDEGFDLCEALSVA